MHVLKIQRCYQEITYEACTAFTFIALIMLIIEHYTWSHDHQWSKHSYILQLLYTAQNSVHPKNVISSRSTNPHFVPNLYCVICFCGTLRIQIWRIVTVLAIQQACSTPHLKTFFKITCKMTDIDSVGFSTKVCRTLTLPDWHWRPLLYNESS